MYQATKINTVGGKNPKPNTKKTPQHTFLAKTKKTKKNKIKKNWGVEFSFSFTPK